MFSPLGLRHPGAVGQVPPSPTRSTARFFAPLVACLAISACDPQTSEPSADVVLTQDNNYTATSVLDLGEPIVTVSGENIEICFDAVDTNLQCHDVDPAEDIKNVFLSVFDDLEVSEIEEMLGKGNIELQEVASYYQVRTDGESTCVSLEDMSFLDSDIDLGEKYVESDSRKYVLVFSSTTDTGKGALSMLLLEPSEDSDVTEVAGVPACGLLEFDAQIADKDAVSVAEDGDALVIGWRDIEVDGIGNEFEPNFATSLLLGFYEDQTPEDLEEGIFDLEQNATEMWEMPLENQRSANLKDAVHREDDENFDGFDGYGEGTWVVALMCDECQNPAPLVLSVLEPE